MRSKWVARGGLGIHRIWHRWEWAAALCEPQAPASFRYMALTQRKAGVLGIAKLPSCASGPTTC
eukprot:1150962-Pelagomonas_calceolata.AAC.2